MDRIMCPDFINKRMFGYGAGLDVVVVGAGGTGSALLGKLFMLNNTIVALGGSPLSVTVYDDDVVSQSNIGRQAFYPFDIGLPKAEVLVNRFNAFGSVQWRFKTERFKHDENAFHSSKVFFGCVDSVEGRKELHKAMNKISGSIYIDCGNDSSTGNVILGMNATIDGKSTYLPTVYDLYKEQLDNHVSKPSDSCSAEEAIQKQEFGVNDLAATHALQMFWQLIRHGELEYQGVSYDLKTGYTAPFKADKDVWGMFGYEVTH